MSSIAVTSIEVTSLSPEKFGRSDKAFKVSGVEKGFSEFEDRMTHYAWITTDAGDDVRVSACVPGVSGEVRSDAKHPSKSQEGFWTSALKSFKVGDLITVWATGETKKDQKIAKIIVGTRDLI